MAESLAVHARLVDLGVPAAGLRGMPGHEPNWVSWVYAVRA